MVTKKAVKTAQAKARMIRVSPRKLNLLAESIRGLKASKKSAPKAKTTTKAKETK